MRLQRLREPTDRVEEIIFGLFCLAGAVFFGYFGLRGSWLYLNGSRAAPADPLAWTIGIGACIALSYLGLRLVLGRHRERVLLPTALLFLAGLAAIAGAAWIIVMNRRLGAPLEDDIRSAAVFLAVGLAALAESWRRTRSARHGS